MLLTLKEYMNKMKIRITKENICNVKREIMENVVVDEIHEDYIERILKDNKSEFYVYYMGSNILINDELCGFCVLRKIENVKTHRAFVLSLIVVKELLRGNGYGTTIFNALIDKLFSQSIKKVIIYIHALEESCVFYKRLGFVQTKHICGYIQDIDNISEKDIIMKYTKIFDIL